MKQNPTYLIAKQKLQNYCSYQERNITEVQKKLQEYHDLSSAEIKQIIQELVEEKFLDEKRYAIAFVRGKFFIKKWGKIKIKNDLRAKKIAPKIIQEALEQISDEDYQHTLQELIVRKKATLRVSNKAIVQKKLINYLLQKGYEFGCIQENLEEYYNNNRFETI